MLRLKGCPRCHGDIELERDHYGWYENCLQCGYLHDLQNELETKAQAIELGKGRELAGTWPHYLPSPRPGDT